ncbi:MAG: aldose epimerase family protein [Bacteroidales bacterium]|nr:aldose epimerase family protein [Bacteroidales bacterium]
MPNSKAASLYTLVSRSGITMKATNYGGIITSLVVPDKNSAPVDVVLGYDNLQGYIDANPYFGAIIGRYSNRIAKGKFINDKVAYTLALNDGSNHLHGGIRGFDKVVWEAEALITESAVGLKFHYLSIDGEEGYPGNLDVRIIYRLTDDNKLIIEYSANTDKATPVNLTQHSYFNLAGKGDIKDHRLMIKATKYVVVDETHIPTGELRNVAGTAFDFTSPKPIGQDLLATSGNPVGYDHNYVLDTESLEDLVAAVSAPATGIVMEVYTDQPGLQFYSGNFLDGAITGKSGADYHQYSGFCLETQHFPDSPNQPDFPSSILRPGEEYRTKSIYRFAIL